MPSDKRCGTEWGLHACKTTHTQTLGSLAQPGPCHVARLWVWRYSSLLLVQMTTVRSLYIHTLYTQLCLILYHLVQWERMQTCRQLIITTQIFNSEALPKSQGGLFTVSFPEPKPHTGMGSGNEPSHVVLQTNMHTRLLFLQGVWPEAHTPTGTGLRG